MNRNEDRIKHFCERLAAAWSKCPDLRFGEFVDGVYGISFGGRPYWIEDDESMCMIEDYGNLYHSGYHGHEGEI